LSGQAEGNIINKATVQAIANPSTASRSERAHLVRDFVKKAEKVHDGEIGLVVVRT
jgi:hypothetical protein